MSKQVMQILKLLFLIRPVLTIVNANVLLKGEIAC